MKLIRASFENFRLLKDVDIEFSMDRRKTVTVIRAANESGKTTMLTALQWGIFGDAALPYGGKDYRLHPIDSPTQDGARIDISVTVDYEVTGKAGPRQYRLIRSAVETVNGQTWVREGTSVRLFHLTRVGAEPLENPDAHIRPYLPLELREVFFTDGDRALSFIEGSRGEQMKRVEAAIRSLLGLNVVEEAIKHVRQVGSDLNKRVKAESGAQGELERVTGRISVIEEGLPELEEKLQAAKASVLRLDDLEREQDRRLTDALRKGNRDELAKELERVRQEWTRSERDAAQAARDHANLFKSSVLARQLLSPTISDARAILDQLHDRGKIPNQTIPVLEERLAQGTCICGELLSGEDSAAVRRRNHIRGLMEQSKDADAVQEIVTALYYSSKEFLVPVQGGGWVDEYAQVFERRQRANSRLAQLGERERDIEAKIANLPDVDIRQLREVRDRYREEREAAVRQEMKLQGYLEDRRNELKKLEVDRQRLLNVDEKGLKLLAELEVSEDLRGLLETALETMKTRELQRVSEHTNRLFLDMIGADAAQRSIIQQAQLTPDFRIVVYGQNGHQLDPSQDLNGASRRALTVAFILALTKVSEVEAPNVIDTPLGMMSGYVKRSVLKMAAEESSQLILFLTHDEIQGCEDILDEKAGKVMTMTNPAHYPKILVNDPGVDDIRIVMCGCDHRHTCDLCARRADAAEQTVLEDA